MFARHHEHLTNTRHRVETDGRESQCSNHVVLNGVAHVDDPGQDVARNGGRAQGARRRLGQPAIARVRAEKVALALTVQGVPARDRRSLDAIDLRRVHERARVDQR